MRSTKSTSAAGNETLEYAADLEMKSGTNGPVLGDPFHLRGGVHADTVHVRRPIPGRLSDRWRSTCGPPEASGQMKLRPSPLGRNASAGSAVLDREKPGEKPPGETQVAAVGRERPTGFVSAVWPLLGAISRAAAVPRDRVRRRMAADSTRAPALGGGSWNRHDAGPDLLYHVWPSILATVAGFAISALVSAAFAAGWGRAVRRAVGPVLHAGRAGGQQRR